jgi:geranyl-CoA carboxylase alpha subunit
MLRKILIANRGEIACRIIRTCQAMGFATVAVFSDADKNALFVNMADEAVHLGNSDPAESYLNSHKLLDAALRTGANAIHPGYGFLAENAGFAYIVKASGLVFIGPPPEAIEAMGDKRYAKFLLRDVPLIPGYMGDDQSDAVFSAAAAEIGYPVMVKASAGGGGKGMRQVSRPEDLLEAVAAAKREAKQAFGDDTLMLEKALLYPRHIEVQIFGDQEGNVIALGERECSIQRRHQKIVEETPSTALNPDLRQRICETAVSIGQQLGYYSAGTIEFLLDENKNFYFMEMNTRLQVEHPVTEMVYGVDLVRWQLEVARGVTLYHLLGFPKSEPLPVLPLVAAGHAIEVRVYAEDPANHFLPVTGTVAHWQAPPLVRTDTGIQSGAVISPHYDPMLAKIIAHGETRTEAIRRLDHALSRTQLLGLKNNLPFLRRILVTDEHLAGIISTRFLEEHPELLPEPATFDPIALIGAALAKQGYQAHWRNNPNRPAKHTFLHGQTAHPILIQPEKMAYRVTIGDTAPLVEIIHVENGHYTLRVNGHQQRVTAIDAGNDQWWVHTLSGTYHLRWQNPLPLPTERNTVEGSLRAPMTGQIVKIMVETGQTVQKGALLLILEAMKMEHRIEAPYAGIVEALRYQVGNVVQADEILLALQPISEAKSE